MGRWLIDIMLVNVNVYTLSFAGTLGPCRRARACAR